MTPTVCYTAALPLLIYALLLMVGVVNSSDNGSVAVLLVVEAVAVVITVYNLALRYRPRKR